VTLLPVAGDGPAALRQETVGGCGPVAASRRLRAGGGEPAGAGRRDRARAATRLRQAG